MSPARFGSEQQIQRFGRGNENVRRFFDQRLTLRGSCIASANFGAHIDVVAFGFTQQCANPSERFLQIFPDIVAQRFQRRDVNDLRFIGQISPCAFSEQRIQRSKEGSQRFSRTRWGRNQHVPAGLNCRPAAHLRFCWRSECLLEPPCDRRMKSEGLHGKKTAKRGTCNLAKATRKKSSRGTLPR